MADRLTLRTLGSLTAMGTLFFVLVASLYVLATTADRLDRFGGYYYWLLLINGLSLSFLSILIGLNGWRLIDEFRRRVAGSRLTMRLVVVSIFLALLPVTLVFAFSVKFLLSNIDSWYDLEIEQALDDALELSREALGLQMRTLQRVTLDIADQLVGVSDDTAIVVMNSLSGNIEASEMTLIGPDNRIVASTGLSSRLSVQPRRPDDDLAARARQGLSYVGVDPVGDGELYIRVVTPVFANDASVGNSVLQALFPVARRSEELAESVQRSYQQYRQLVFLRKPLKISSIVTLSLALLLSVLMAVWFAMYAARRLMVPIHDLVEGTQSVAEGDYSTRIYKRGHDEIGYLVQSFNYMTLQLENTRQQAESSQAEVERQRAYLQTVLGHISSGVLTIDADGLIRTCNQAAMTILGLQGDSLVGRRLNEFTELDDSVGQFAIQVLGQVDAVQSEAALAAGWSAEMDIVDRRGRRFLVCRGATLGEHASGSVIVFDDMTTLISAQRDAAWSEVARRLAHEIKNPLTPIQLSAERLRRKIKDKLDDHDASVLTRLTNTIETQVDSMKSMVNAFAAYASTPRLQLNSTNLNELVVAVAELYQDSDSDIDITLSLGTALPEVVVDASRIRQLVHNLIKNSLEAQAGSEQKRLELLTEIAQSGGNRFFVLMARDRGPGFPVELLNRLFEPYVSSKPRGSGLGLAIVKKIVEEHNGTVVAENRPDAGAIVTVHLPLPAGAASLQGDAA